MRASCTTEDQQRPSSPVKAPGTKPPRRRKSTKTMNNAENHTTVEVKRKAAKEDARYEMIERGESKQLRNFEKPDKPDDSGDVNITRVADSLTTLPPEDLRNVGLLALLCITSELLWLMMGRFITGCSCWIGIWQCSVFVEGKVIVWTGWGV